MSKNLTYSGSQRSFEDFHHSYFSKLSDILYISYIDKYRSDLEIVDLSLYIYLSLLYVIYVFASICHYYYSNYYPLPDTKGLL